MEKTCLQRLLGSAHRWIPSPSRQNRTPV